MLHLLVNPSITMVLEDFTLTRFEENVQQCIKFLIKAEELSSTIENDNDRVTLKIFANQLETFIDGSEFQGYFYPVCYLEGVQIDFQRLAEWASPKSRKDFEDLIKRYQKFDKYSEQIIEMLKLAVLEGKVYHKISMDGVLSQIERHITPTSPKETVFWKPFESSFPLEMSDLLPKAEQAITDSVQSGFKKLHAYIKNEYLNNTRSEIGCTTLPNGKKYYAALLKFHTSTNYTAEEIHNIGLKEVEKIENQMKKIVNETGNGSTNLKEFANKLHQLEIGTKDGKRPGRFYVNTHNYKSQPIYESISLSLHEGNPGHHLQSSYLLEQPDLPQFRSAMEDRIYTQAPSRFPIDTAYVEGWALYCEELGFDLDLYDNPYERYGHLSEAAFRACRLVVDTGMHALGWSQENAIQYMHDHTAASLENIESEIKRYITWPGQATGYKIGQLKIRALREIAEAALKEKFDIRDFHEIVLMSAGPLDIVEAERRCFLDSKIRIKEVDLSKIPPDYIRNISIIAHVDHGKSTLADRILEYVGAIDKSVDNKQVLDKLRVERERGITVKAQTASIIYSKGNMEYLINLIDTPGHVDFASEVTRSLKACQGVCSSPFSEDKAIIPVLNKVDLPKADPEEGNKRYSWYDRFKGATNLVQVTEGVLSIGMTIASKMTDKSYSIKSLGLLTPDEFPVAKIYPGQMGYMACSGSDIEPVVDVIPCKPMVFAGFYPIDQNEYVKLKSAIEKVCLNDASVSVTPECCVSLGQGYRLGFLGILHLEVFSQRLDDEYGAQVVITSPNWPDKNIEEYHEPMVRGIILAPSDYLRACYGLIQEYRGKEVDTEYIDDTRVKIDLSIPLNEILTEFFNELKLRTSGFGSFDYSDDGYKRTTLTKVEILINGEPMNELARICHISKSDEIARKTCETLKELMPRRQFLVTIQARLNGRIIARENVKALKKDVTAKCYGGDLSRQRKLLKNQAEGKKKLKESGKYPSNSFIR
ncbi:GUF1 [Lepeophtheirus salmonis]|uniref:GUF1 n=1 Tax=Lepeophtheirus salmonis TaxID=72036 RepID=A0A7R8H7I7_LEPSM|nr:GUF1 [Lepeophtheirus salmonis]CAF2921413.1 GUF1 [Lepeophtheirus salmonis]